MGREIRIERMSYYLRRNAAIQKPNNFFSCIIDGSTQVDSRNYYVNCPITAELTFFFLFQAAYGLPHFCQNHHDVENSQRLKCHITAALVHGDKPYVYLNDDRFACTLCRHKKEKCFEPPIYFLFLFCFRVPSNASSMTINVIINTLEQHLSRPGARPLPPTAFFQFDNCSGPNKNQYLFAFFGWLIHLGVCTIKIDLF